MPDGYFIVRPATFSVWVPWRSFLVGSDPKRGVDLVKRHMRIYRPKDAANPPPLNFVSVSGKGFSTLAPADYAFWEYLNQVVQEEPTESLDPVTLGLYASVGIQKGKPFAPDARMKKILTEAARVGDATARAINFRLRIKGSYYYTNSAWRTACFGGYKFKLIEMLRLNGYSTAAFGKWHETSAWETSVSGPYDRWHAHR